MKKTILYTLGLIATIATAVFTVFVGCDGDFGERSEKMNAFLNKFGGYSDTVTIKYTITFNANGGNGSPPDPLVVIAGSKTILPNEGKLIRTHYEFDGWNTDSLGTGENYAKGLSYKPTSDVTLYAKWKDETKTTARVEVISEGTNASGGGSYESGTTVTIKAGDVSGKQFQNWTTTTNGVIFASSTSPTTTFAMPAYNVTVTANFIDIPEGSYAVTVLSVGVGASGGGSFSGGTRVSINAGKDPYAHRFKNWTTESNGVKFVDANNRTTTFTMPENAVTVTANFVKVPTFEVKVSSVGSGASSDSSYREGDTVTIKAGTAPSGKRFKNWTVTEGEVTLGNADSANTKFIMPAKAVTLTANFGDDKYTVTVSAGIGAMGGGGLLAGEYGYHNGGNGADRFYVQKLDIFKQRRSLCRCE